MFLLCDVLSAPNLSLWLAAANEGKFRLEVLVGFQRSTRTLRGWHLQLDFQTPVEKTNKIIIDPSHSKQYLKSHPIPVALPQ
jgi:hypothetical protein